MMLKLLIEKQLREVFRSYFYDTKKNQKRKKSGIILRFVLFGAIMILLLGGVFAYLSFSLCGPFQIAGVGWLYFTIMSSLAVLLGAFGSVFNTFSSLYLSKDNDLLLSMPIPVRDIIASRLANVYLLGLMYSAVVFIPAIVVYWIVAGVTAGRVICGLLLGLIISLIVLILSCLLGWCVAKISLKLKRKSFMTVIISLLFIAAYYFFYFKAQTLLQDLAMNAEVYGSQIKGSAYFLYLFGRVGEGDAAATAIILVACLALLAVTWLLLKKTFLSIAISSGSAARVHRKTAGPAKEKTVSRALLSKEFARFTSSSTYMLNCGLGILLIPLFGVLLLAKGTVIVSVLNDVFSARPGSAVILLCTVLFMVSTMNDMAAPSVSLEGKSIWIPLSMPVNPCQVLRAKLKLQLILTAIPMLIAIICVLIILKAAVLDSLLLCLVSLLFVVFSAIFSLILGVKMPNLLWTSEIVPIKQNGAVLIAIFSGWGFAALFAVPFFIIGYKWGVLPYLAIWSALFAVASLLLLRWLDTKGAARFSSL